MRLIIAKIGHDPVIGFAFDELVRLAKAMDKNIFIDGRTYDAYDPSLDTVLWLGFDGSVAENKLDDEIRIDVKNAAGIITGSNPRSVLIAVYRFMHELGCRFIRPGDDGEIIPQKKLTHDSINVDVAEKAAYRHRAYCIEGANSYEHVYNVINWLPKVGMNGYFVQFQVPTCFFDRWYLHTFNPTYEVEPITQDDIHHIWSRLEEEIDRRGLIYHAVGHGWTCEPFGVSGANYTKDTPIPENIKQYFAEVDGKRDVWRNGPIDTNLCYSNPKVVETINDAIVDYCKKNPSVDYLHFWLADGTNNHCECPECRKKLPSDHYVTMLNDLDKRMAAAGVDTKVVFLIYVDLLWAPMQTKIENSDRFVLMFAPITRSYTNALCDFDRSEKVEIKPYERNNNNMPKSVAENVAMLDAWRKSAFDGGDSFDFDYHLMWDHIHDPGYYECARILHRDMVNLDQIGLNGMVSCQIQRCAFPTNLPDYAMARGLWDKTSGFEAIADEYFTASFGEEAQAVKAYMKKLSELFDPEYLRGEKGARANADMVKQYASVPSFVNDFEKNYIDKHSDDNESWKYLKYHAEFTRLFADILKSRAEADTESAKAKFEKLKQFLCNSEPELHTVLDVWNHIWTIEHRYTH